VSGTRELLERLNGKKVKEVIVERGYKGIKNYIDAKIYVP